MTKPRADKLPKAPYREVCNFRTTPELRERLGEMTKTLGSRGHKVTKQGLMEGILRVALDHMERYYEPAGNPVKDRDTLLTSHIVTSIIDNAVESTGDQVYRRASNPQVQKLPNE